jgi:ribonuclease Z
MLRLDIDYRLAHHDDLKWRPVVSVAEAEEGVVFQESGVRVTCAPTDHRPVQPTLGYRIDEGSGSIVIAGDTVPCAGLDQLCLGADVLVHTVIRRDLITAIGHPRLTDVIDYHSSVEDAAQTAARTGVEKLVLVHLVPPPTPATEHEWVDLARAYFNGEVLIAADLDSVDPSPETVARILHL